MPSVPSLSRRVHALLRTSCVALVLGACVVAQSAWKPMPWPAARGYSAVSYDPNTSSVLMVAGDNDFRLGDTWRWNGNTASWQSLIVTGAPTARYAPAVVYDIARNTHVLFGGDDGVFQNQTFLWNVTSGNWQQIVPGTSPGGRAYHAMAYDPARGRVVLFGGYANGNYGDTWEWDGNNWYSITVVNPPSPRYGHAMAYVPQSNATMLFGGVGPSAQTWLWNGTTWTLQSPPQSPAARYYHAMAYDPVHSQVVLFGGWNGTTSVSDTWTWDGTTGSWNQASANGPSARHLHSMTFDASRGRVVLFGGVHQVPGASLQYLSDVWEWNGAAWTQVHDTSPSSRTAAAGTFHAGATPATRHTMVFGGRIGPFTSNLVIGDTWLWNGTTWAQPVLAASPPARAYSSSTFDVARGETLLFGGWTPNTLGDTWVWDGSTWTQRSPATSPSARHGHKMTYHAGLGQVVLFGGHDGASKNDLWAWDGTTWSNITPVTGNPAARWHHAIAYDPPNNRIVLFGGYSGSGYYGDTWAWSSGTGWTQLAPTLAPPPRAYHAMQFDPSRGYVVVVDGYNNGFYQDTWELRGAQWVLCAQTQPPPARDNHVLTFDPDRARLYMFGGDGTGGDFWEAYNPWPASFTQLAGSSGCPVAAGPTPILGLNGNNLPWLGSVFQVTQSNLPTTGVPLSLILFGVAPAIAVPLPWPGCTLYTNPVTSVVSVGSSPHTTGVLIPWQYSLLGIELICQGGVLNGTDIGASAAHVARIGTRH